MDLAKLKAEITADPLTRGYLAMTDAQAAASLNASDRASVRTLIPSHEVIEATVAAEWSSLSAAEKQRYQTFIAAGTVNAAGTNTRAAFLAMFGAGTTTRANLSALQTGPTVTRAAELGLPFIGAHHVTQARAS